MRPRVTQLLYAIPNHWDDEKTEIWQPPARVPAHTPPPMPAPELRPLAPVPTYPIQAPAPAFAPVYSSAPATVPHAPAPARRRWPRWLAFALAVLAVLAVSAVFITRAVAEHMVRSRALPALAAVFDRPVDAGDIDVSWDAVVIRDLSIGELGAVEQITVDFTVVDLLGGRVRVDAVEARGVSAWVSPAELDELLDRLAARVEAAGAERSARSVDFAGARVVARDIAVVAADPDRGLTAAIEIDALSPEGRAALSFNGATLTLTDGADRSPAGALLAANPVAGVSGTVERDADGLVRATVEGHFAGDETQRFRGSVAVDPREIGATRSLRIGGEAVALDRVLAAAAIVTGRDLTGLALAETAKTRLGGDVVVALDGDALTARGTLELDDLAIANRRLARAPVDGLTGSLELDVAIDRRGDSAAIHRAIWTPDAAPSVRYQLTASARRSPRALTARLEIPETDCQAMLASLPPALIPDLAGFELRGRFAAAVDLAIDMSDLDATVFGGSVGIDGCEVVEAPAAKSAERLRKSFEHTVPIGDGKTRTYVIGPENPDFVAVDHVSRNLIRSLLTTEDGSFFRHDGFRAKEFRTALVKNLERGRFAYGASSISMQMVKNVLLSREKTVSRKLQELFLTWYVESALSKKRILEIYLNAIEFGPGLYGIKPAARQYFGKHPRRLNPVESAFFSSILPAPRRRFRQYCRGWVGGWTRNKMDRIIDRMFDGNRLDPDQYLTAIETPLVFRGKRRQLCKGVK